MSVFKSKLYVMIKTVDCVKGVAENGTGWVEIKSLPNLSMCIARIDGTHQLSSAWGVAPQNFM